MTCDDAFERLTLPGGPDDPQLASHLSQCARCRAMAETLAPAIELFAKPSPKPEAAAVSTAVAEKAAARLSRRAESPIRRRWFVGQNSALLIAAISGAACCFLAIELGSSGPEPSVAACPRKSPEAIEWLERHDLPIAMACMACHPTGTGPSTLPALGRSL